MDAPTIDRHVLRLHLQQVEAAWPISFLGVLPPGTLGHVTVADSLTFLADAGPTLDLLDMAGIELELSERFGKPVGVLPTSAIAGPRLDVLRRSLLAL